jgi:hypothetical protein
VSRRLKIKIVNGDDVDFQCDVGLKFQVDNMALWDAVMREMGRQEKLAAKKKPKK